MLTRRTAILSLSAAVTSLATGSGLSLAESSFDGQTITYIVATKAGGGYDTMARLVAKYLEKYLEGTGVRVKNVSGGGHVVGALEIFNAAPDGLTIGTFNSGLLYAQFLGQLKPPLDLHRFEWIGKAAVETRLLVSGADTPFYTLDDLRQVGRPIRCAASGVRSASYFDTVILARALDFAVKIIPGFEGKEGELSLMRGEVDCIVGSGSALLPFVRNGFGRAIVQVGGGTGSTIPEAKNFARTNDAKSLIDLIGFQAQLSRLTAAPPGTNPLRLAALRKAYMEALSDPKFLEEASMLDLPIAPMDGKHVAAAVKQALNPKLELIAEIKKLLPSE
ncbi:Bug family tripartite tricarboxylate transporter substrate binding protein [Aestuariivirga sp.]|jgi:tripartite-type tricarboxylate transporter receptor subunit TctC|uniref:Bug family tripartite tricarboxylate transporter substrate binding protein n=1 Tax=Aestuariivirga sp. TaxID=2650926 RepID=UPI003783634E